MNSRKIDPFCLNLVNCCGLCFVDMRGILEEELLRAAMHQFSGNISRAARNMGISRSWLNELLKRYEIRREDYESDYQGGESERVSESDEEFIDLIMRL